MTTAFALSILIYKKKKFLFVCHFVVFFGLEKALLVSFLAVDCLLWYELSSLLFVSSGNYSLLSFRHLFDFLISSFSCVISRYLHQREVQSLH